MTVEKARQEEEGERRKEKKKNEAFRLLLFVIRVKRHGSGQSERRGLEA